MGAFSQANGLQNKQPAWGNRPSKGEFGKRRKALKKKSKNNLATDEDRKYLQWFKEQGFACMVCGSPEVESHHIKEFSSDKKNHTELLPLCAKHHRLGSPSPHKTPRLFRKHYPLDKQKEIAKQFHMEYLSIV